MKLNFPLLFLMAWVGLGALAGAGPVPETLFQNGLETYQKGDFSEAAKLFRESVDGQPSSGGWQNVGLAEWRCGRVGEAIVAWERAGWLDPANRPVRENLAFVRKTAQLDAPLLAWNEIPSTWLSINAWAWLGGVSLWLSVGLITLPGILRRPRSAWPPTLAAIGLAVFLLSIPAQIGAHSRAHIGFVVGPGASLRLSPTRDAEIVMPLAPGEPARREFVRGNYVFVRTSRGTGWLERDQLALIGGK